VKAGRAVPLSPSDAASHAPTLADPDGTPMTFIGQFAAGEVSNLMPSFA
jgi:hypothetical protein